MKIYYDLHIHSALSPCGDDDMTPNNVINMARHVMGLDAIALTDHNCAANIPAFSSAAEKAGLLFVPGIELNTEEEVHLLAYFRDVKSAIDFGDFVYDSLPDIPNNEKFFGRQLIYDENDEITGKKEKLLISALPYSFEECLSYIKDAGGIAVPAHINKSSNSLINNLGFIPESDLFNTIEVSKSVPGGEYPGFKQIHSSDAHYLENISERENFFEMEEKSLNSLFCCIL